MSMDRQTELFLTRVGLTMEEKGLDIASAMKAVIDRDAELLNFFASRMQDIAPSLAATVYVRCHE